MPVLDLGDLVDPSKYHEPLEISAEDPEILRGQLRKMLCIRLVEQQLARARRDGLIGGPVHLGVGQEAVAVGVSACLRSSDRVFGAHRSHSHVLALGSEVYALFAEVLGRDTGLSRGMGGSMHLWDAPRGFYGSVPIVAGTVPLAVGAGLAAKLQGVDDIGVSYLGDGAVEEGVVQESLNLARTLRIPVLFVVENNLFSSHMHIGLRQPSNATARFAQAHDVPFAIVDGNDVVAVSRATRQLVELARTGKGPGFLEAVTYRWLGHVDWREDIDVGVSRSIEELRNWRARDPIGRLAAALERVGEWSQARQDKLVEEINAEIKLAWNRALADPWPKPEALLDRVYAPAVPQ
jgi:TPP-dependent pyruvate/acetoin dehydrogenase alpha subunit